MRKVFYITYIYVMKGFKVVYIYNINSIIYLLTPILC